MSQDRKQFLADAGEPLIAMPDPDGSASLSTLHPLVAEARKVALAEALGDDAEVQIILPPFATVPWPMLVPVEGGHRLGIPNLDPKLLWHPMFWLGRDYASPAYDLGAEGEEISWLEDPAEWVMRLFLELENAGIYDPETGTFEDVLLTRLGLDVENDADLSRVQQWMHGAEDEELEGLSASIDASIAEASTRENPGYPMWASDEAAIDSPIISLISLAAQCADMVDLIDGRGVIGDSADDAPMSDEELAVLVVELAQHALWVDDEDAVVLDGERVPIAQVIGETYRSLVASADGGQELPDDLAPQGVIGVYRQLFEAARSQLIDRANEIAAEDAESETMAEIEA